jgi:hypothetical protein
MQVVERAGLMNNHQRRAGREIQGAPRCKYVGSLIPSGNSSTTTASKNLIREAALSPYGGACVD